MSRQPIDWLLYAGEPIAGPDMLSVGELDVESSFKGEERMVEAHRQNQRKCRLEFGE